MGKLKATFSKLSRLPWRGLGEGVGLTLALTFVFLMAFIPHLDTFSDPVEGDQPAVLKLGQAGYEHFVTGEREGYPYTIHVDENVHWGYSAGVQRHDTVFVGWTGGEPSQAEGFFSLRGAVHERGFHIILAEAQELTGVSFKGMFHYLPALWMVFTAFAVYASIRPHPAAIPAAAFVGLIPTTPRFLGPAILVPIGFVLAWIPIVLILSEPAKKKAASAALLLGVVGWAFFVHLIGGFAAVGMLALAALFGAAHQRKAMAKLIALSLLPLAWLWRTFQADVQVEIAREESLPIDFTIFDGFGVLALFGWAAGVVALTLWYRDETLPKLSAWAAFSMGALGLIVATTVFDWGTYATYARWHPPFFLAAAVPLGFLVVAAGRWLRDGLRALGDRFTGLPRHVAKGATVLGAVLLLLVPVGLSLSAVEAGTEDHLGEPYYHVMDDASWASFSWIAANAGPEHQVFLTHPWRAPILSAMTGMEPHAYLNPGQPPIRGEDYQRFARTGGTLELFVMNDITLTSTSGKPPFPVFQDAGGPDVWVMEEEIAAELAALRAQARAG